MKKTNKSTGIKLSMHPQDRLNRVLALASHEAMTKEDFSDLYYIKNVFLPLIADTVATLKDVATDCEMALCGDLERGMDDPFICQHGLVTGLLQRFGASRKPYVPSSFNPNRKAKLY